MTQLRQPKRQATLSWDRYDLACGVYLVLLLIALAFTGIGLARGDLPSEKIPHHIVSNQ